MTVEFDEEDFGGSYGLADGLGLPAFFGFDVEEIITHLTFAKRDGITSKVIVEQTHVPVVGMTGAVGVVTQGEQLGELVHRRPGMLVVERVDVLASTVSANLVLHTNAGRGCFDIG